MSREYERYQYWSMREYVGSYALQGQEHDFLFLFSVMDPLKISSYVNNASLGHLRKEWPNLLVKTNFIPFFLLELALFT